MISGAGDSTVDGPLFSKLSLSHILSAAVVFLAGAGAGFFTWFFTVTSQTFNSYLFHNNLTIAERGRLLLLLSGGVALFLSAWILVAVFRGGKRYGAASVPQRSSVYFAPGILLGFWPFFAVQAYEVFYTFQLLFLVVGFLAACFLILYCHGRLAGARDRSGVSDRSNRSKQMTGSRPRFSLGTGRSKATGSVTLALLLLCTIAYAVFFIAWTLSRHRSFHSYAFDLGWQHQAFHTLLHTGNPRITLYVTLNHLGNHFQPLYYLLAPIYALHQDATTLLVLQTILLASAAVPLYLIARRRIGNPVAALLIAVVYLLYPALHGINNFDFHGLALLIPFVFCILYALETERFWLFWLFFSLALITREDTAVSLSGLGLYLILDRRRRKLGILVLGICVAYFLFVLRMMAAFGGSADLQNYAALTTPEHQNFTGVLLTLFTNPQFILHHVFSDPRKLEYLLQILIPVLVLPFFAGKSIVALLPGLGIMLLSNTFFNYWIYCPYSAHIIPYVFFLAVLGIEKIRNRHPAVGVAALLLPLFVAGVLMNYQFGLIFSKRFPGFLQPTERQQTAYSLFEQIPAEASLTTARRLAPHLTARTEIHLFEAPHPDTEYILIDLDLPEPAIDSHEHWYHTQEPDHLKARSYVLSRLESGDYGVVRYQDRFILLGKGFGTASNAEVARSVRSLQYPNKPTIVSYFRDPAENVNPPRHSQADLLQDFLNDHRRETIVLAASGDVAGRLSYLCKKQMMMCGSNIHNLRRGGSYLAVFRHNRVVLELIGNGQPVAAGSADCAILQSLFPHLQMDLYSPGSGANRGAWIRISGQEYASNQAGMNAVVLDGSGRVRAQAVFSTGR